MPLPIPRLQKVSPLAHGRPYAARRPTGLKKHPQAYRFQSHLSPGKRSHLIVIEQARIHGVEISFREHARIGVPVTLFSLVVLFAWIAVT